MVDRPLPVRDEVNGAYWDGALAERLVIQRCSVCAIHIHPPRRACPSCGGQLEPTEVSGKGTVYGWSIMCSPGNPGFDDKLPYAVLVVELVEQPRLITIGNLMGGDPASLAIGAPVEVCFERVTEDIALPQWRLVI